MSRRKTKKKSHNLEEEDDSLMQEAVPEDLRAEIDDIIKNFLSSSETEYTFTPGLSNIQRKYIHIVAQNFKLRTRSRGKQPDRKLSIFKESRKKIPRAKSKKTKMAESINKHETSPPSEEEESNIEDESVKSSIPDLNNVDQAYNIELTEVSNLDLAKILALWNFNDFLKRYGTKVVPKRESRSIFSSFPGHVPAPRIPRDIESFKRTLPITSKKFQIMDYINRNQVTIISSETGSGKTTQVPQFILEDSHKSNRVCRIICTQPRRIATVAVAKRVSRERGDYIGNSVGYHIHLESKLSRRTNLLYCTNGVLIRSLMSPGLLRDITHIIIDEVHERDRLSDFLLICLKKALPNNPNLKLILMSATVNVEKFKDYFQSVEVLQVPGRVFPIEEYFLEDILEQTGYMPTKKTDKRITAERSPEEIDQGLSGSNQRTTKEAFKDEIIEEMDEALGDCLRYNRPDAWAQLMLYICGENFPVDYQHSETGLTALMVAAVNNNIQNLITLQGFNADKDIKCHRNRTALDWAELHKFQQVVELLNQYTHETQSEKLLEQYVESVSDKSIDFMLITHVVTYIHRNQEPGAILVFLAGYDDIMLLSKHITDALEDVSDSYKLFHLHSSMRVTDQQTVFSRLPNKRKIILSTNIAETSITIDDVKFIVDSGKAKEQTFDSFTGLCTLQMDWISKACVRQRTGRAGRTSNGYCYHIYSRQRYNHFQEERTPEMLRVSLDGLCLNTKVIAPDVPLEDFFQLAPDPPCKNLVESAIETLIYMGAMNQDEKLSPLGEYLGKLSTDPHLGKMLIYSIIFGCLNPIVTLVSIIMQTNPFILPAQACQKQDAASKRKALADDIPSDHIVYITAFEKWLDCKGTKGEWDFLHDNYLSKSVMETGMMIRSHLLSQLKTSQFLSPYSDMNANSKNRSVIKAVIATGLYPRVAYLDGKRLCTMFQKSVYFSNKSCLYGTKPTYDIWYIYDELTKAGGKPTLKCATAVTPLTIALLCGNCTDFETADHLKLDNWLTFKADEGVLFLRKSLDLVINKIFTTSEKTLKPHEKDVIKLAVSLLAAEDKAAGLLQQSDTEQPVMEVMN